MALIEEIFDRFDTNIIDKEFWKLPRLAVIETYYISREFNFLPAKISSFNP